MLNSRNRSALLRAASTLRRHLATLPPDSVEYEELTSVVQDVEYAVSDSYTWEREYVHRLLRVGRDYVASACHPRLDVDLIEFVSGEFVETVPLVKLSRWTGYVQGVLIERGRTTVARERERTRPLLRPMDFPPPLDPA